VYTAATGAMCSAICCHKERCLSAIAAAIHIDRHVYLAAVL
jgi:hypothetical protein